MTRRAKEMRQKRLEQKKAAETPEELERRAKWNQLLQQIDAPPRPRALSAPKVLTWNSSHAVVGAASKFELPVRVECETAEVSYSFETKEMDIFFSIAFITAATGKESYVVQAIRCASHEGTARGTHIVNGPGTLILTWDNEYSWINSKQLSYHVDLIQKDPPEESINTSANLLETELLKRQKMHKAAMETYENLQGVISQRVSNIKSIEDQIKALHQQLAKEKELQALELKEAEKIERDVDILSTELAALSIRTLSPSLVSHVLSFCSPSDWARWLTINKSWHVAILQLHNAEIASK